MPLIGVTRLRRLTAATLRTMPADHPLPEEFLSEMTDLEEAYLASSDPIRQSGFGGGDERWRAERGMVLGAIDHDGSLLDVGCANGWLLACLVKWAAPLRLVPFGVDLGARLVQLAEERLKPLGGQAWCGDAWVWSPPMTFDYVYTIANLAPEGMEGALIRRVSQWVKPGGRAIIGEYGSRSRGIAPRDVAAMVRAAGFEPLGTVPGGHPPITVATWFDPAGG